MHQLAAQTAAALDLWLEDDILWLSKTTAHVGYGVDQAMVDALHAVFGYLDSNPQIRALVIDSKSGFHGGAIVFAQLKPELSQLDADDFGASVDIGHDLGQRFAALPIPVISIAEKGALGGGLELMLRSDFVYCTDAAQFTFPEVTVGLFPSWGSSQWGARLMLFRKAQEFILLGEPMDGRSAEQSGLVTRSFPDRDTLYAHVARVIERLRRRISPDGFRGAKASMAEAWAGNLQHGLAAERRISIEVKQTGAFVTSLGARRAGKTYDFVDGVAVDVMPADKANQPFRPQD